MECGGKVFRDTALALRGAHTRSPPSQSAATVGALHIANSYFRVIGQSPNGVFTVYEKRQGEASLPNLVKFSDLKKAAEPHTYPSEKDLYRELAGFNVRTNGSLPNCSDQAYAEDMLPRLIVEHYENGVICGGEVFNQYLDYISEDNINEWMLELTPELLARFRNSVENFDPSPADYILATEADLATWRHAASLMRAWFRQQRSEPGAPPNGGPPPPPANSNAGGGSPSVS